MRWLPYLNLVLVFAIALVGSMLFFLPTAHDEVFISSSVTGERELPKSPFAHTDEAFQELDEGPFALHWVAPQMQLPDLRSEILFLGKNQRPDNPGTHVHLSLKGSEEGRAVEEGKRTYLVYSGNGQYLFSPENQPTSLWIVVHQREQNRAEIIVHMLDEKAAMVTSPPELHMFIAQAQAQPQRRMGGWELGGFRVDTTLLVRQKTRWIGPDRFLEFHGGDEYAFCVNRERIDFLNQESSYSCFVKENDFIVWKKDHWEVAQEGETTQNLPLMVVKKIDEKIMSLELWDPEGGSKTNLSLIRARDRDGIPNLSHEFKFVGAKTWAQFIVECKPTGRLTLKPHDWLVLTQEGWKKLDTPEEIDDFVEQRVVGPLFVLEKLTKENGRQTLVGHLFNTTRTHVEQVELAATPNTSLANFYRTIPVIPPIQIKEDEGEE